MTMPVSSDASHSTKDLDRLVDRAGELFSLPAVTLEVLELTSNPQVNLPQLKECIEKDPALTVRILRVVNSSLFGLSTSVSDLNQAIALLGCRPLKLLVLGFRLPQGLFQGVAAAMLKRYWHLALAKAVAARQIAERLEGIPPDEAFIAGLLQDIGILVMLQGVGDTYVEFLDKVIAEREDLPTMQRQVLGFDHTQLSSRMFERWGLPQLFVDAVLMPADDEPVSSDTEATALASVVQLAGLFATMMVDNRPDLWPRLEQLATSTGGLSRDELSDLGDSLQERVGLLADAMQIDLPNDRDYAATMSQAHAQLAEVAAGAAVELARKENDAQSPGSAWNESISLEDAVSRFQFNVSPIGGNIAAGEPQAAGMPQESAAPLLTRPSSGTTPSAAPRPRDRQEIGPLGRQQLDKHLSVAVAACRRRRCALSLLLIECGAEESDEVLTDRVVSVERLVAEAIAAIDHNGCRLLKLGPNQFAAILPDCDRHLAVEMSGDVISDVAEFARAVGEIDPDEILLSIGVSSVPLAPKNFSVANLVEGASRCLYGASAAGGSNVKSIEIY